jgi:ATP-dependent exoDNAse (exonuclease V) alpha subunit
MAIFRMEISSISRGTGRRATAAAAYRAGERIRDERTGDLHNYRQRRDVTHVEIFLPSQLENAAWARNRERLWNTAEHAEKRHNARVAREYQVTLPSELNPSQRLALARAFSQEIAERYRVAVDLAVHDPRPGDVRNFHAHLLTTTREVTPAGLGAKTGLDMHTRERRRHELPDHRQEYVNLRERWATLTNEALRDAHVAARIDHRSLAAQGIDREPHPTIPLMHLKMEQRGLHSTVADRLRTEYRERVRNRLERAAVPAHDTQAAAGERSTAATTAASGASQIRDPDEIRRQAVKQWLHFRAQEAEKSGGQFRDQERGSEHSTPERDAAEPESERQAQDDLAL